MDEWAALLTSGGDLLGAVAWPGAATAMTFILRSPLGGVLDAISKRLADPKQAVEAKLFGAAASLGAQSAGDIVAPDALPSLEDEAVAETVVEGAVTLGPEQLALLQQIIANQQNEATHWHFEYLNLLLVPLTKYILRWIGVQPARASEAQLWLTWGQYADETNRAVTLEVLKQHDLIAVDETQRLFVTERGSRFVDWITAKGAFLPGA